jgi:CheY-like chemotaxis protein
MGNEVQKERRKYKRIPFREDILIDGMMHATLIDISEGGLFVCAVQPFSIDTVLELSIPLKGKMLTVKARVQYYESGIGMGLIFINLNEEQKADVRRLIESITTKPVQTGVEKKILLIEDSDTYRQELKSSLVMEGFSIIEASDGVEAVKYLAELSPDLIILDLYMEKMDGFKVLSILKLHPNWKEIPVIVCSAGGTQDVMQKVIDAGADEFLDKMVTSTEKLVEVAKAVLKRDFRR